MRDRHCGGVRLGNLLGSPLAIVSIGVMLAGVWTLGYGVSSSSADTSPRTPAAIDESGVLEAVRPDQRMGPKLLQPPPNDQLGLDIAIEDRDGKSMDALHRALARAEAGEGQARLLFYGASHVASDLFTGYIRRELQTRFGDAGHGFLLPVHPWRTYRHRDINIESDGKRWETQRIRVGDSEVEQVGLAGLAMVSSRVDSFGAVYTAEQGDYGKNAGFFELYYKKHPRGGEFDVYIDGRKARRISTRAPKVSTGYATFRVPDAPHRFEIRTLSRRPVWLYGLAVERDQPGVVVDTLGINGSRVRYQLLWDDEVYQEHLRRRKPDLVVLAYGTNESGDESPLEDYERNLRAVLQRMRDTVPEASCLLIGPSDRPMQVEERVFEDRARTASLIEVQHRVALDNGCGFFDLVAFQGGALSMVQWAANDPAYASQDHIHYTRIGYQRLGEVLLSALLEGMPER
ncbi:MAG: GDSL-type esterase/lipase family protein [Polyangiales bacterium]